MLNRLKRVFAVFYRGSVPGITAWWAGAGGVIGWFLLFVPALSGLIPAFSAQPPLTVGVVGAFIGLIVGCSSVSRERDELKTTLEDHETHRSNWIYIADTLGQYGIEGKRLIPKPYVSVASWDEIDQWKKNAADFIESKLGQGHRFLFESGAGNEPRVPDKIVNAEDRERWIHIQARLMTLKQIIWRCVDKADRLPKA